MANWQPTRQIQQKNPFTEAGALFDKAMSGAISIGDTMAKKTYDSAQSALDAELALATDPNDVEAVKKKILAQSTNNGKFLDPGKALQQANSRTKDLNAEELNVLERTLKKSQIEGDIDRQSIVQENKTAEELLKGRQLGYEDAALEDQFNLEKINRELETNRKQFENKNLSKEQKLKLKEQEAALLGAQKAISDYQFQEKQKGWEAAFPAALEAATVQDDSGNVKEVNFTELFNRPEFEGMPFSEQIKYQANVVAAMKTKNNLVSEVQAAKLAKDSATLSNLVKDNYNPKDKEGDFGIGTIIDKAFDKNVDPELVNQLIPRLSSLGLSDKAIKDIKIKYKTNEKNANQAKYFDEARIGAEIPTGQYNADGTPIKALDATKYLELASGKVDNPLQKLREFNDNLHTLHGQEAGYKREAENLRLKSIAAPFDAMTNIVKEVYGESSEDSGEAQFALLRLKEAFSRPEHSEQVAEFISKGGMDTLYKGMSKATDDSFVWDEVFGEFDPEELRLINKIVKGWDSKKKDPPGSNDSSPSSWDKLNSTGATEGMDLLQKKWAETDKELLDSQGKKAPRNISDDLKKIISYFRNTVLSKEYRQLHDK